MLFTVTSKRQGPPRRTHLAEADFWLVENLCHHRFDNLTLVRSFTALLRSPPRPQEQHQQHYF
jgi:hypothetical protein